MTERRLTEEAEEKDTRRRKNPRERAAMDAYQKNGWIITTRGFPCFLAQKPGQRPRFVWVERKNINPAKAGLSKCQRKALSIFKTLGLDARIVSPQQELVCDLDSPLQAPPIIW
jgi:hypothetical protein